LSAHALLSHPSDGPRWAALIAAALAVWLLPRLFAAGDRRAARLLLPLCASALSAAYVAYYLRGGPRIIDATAYYLEARTLSRGLLTIPLAEPEHATLGRFLLRTTQAGEPAASVIFPPGYPAILAIGFVLGAPLAIGPLLAAAVTAATMSLCQRVIRYGPSSWREQEGSLIVGSGVLSVVCAALRYHTADTMSHGLAALCFTSALSAAFAALDHSRRGSSPGKALAVVGFAAGLLWATRPATALALGVGLVAALLLLPGARRLASPRALATLALAALPPVVLWLAYQRAATGSITDTAQSAYYAVSDGPPGCFRYGFGEGIGCLGEHRDFVVNSIGPSFDLRAVLGTTGRRLKMHLEDALNVAPLFPLVLFGMLHARRTPAVGVLAAAVMAQALLYLPFYFDGNYPGGGARLYADILPLEHVLATLGMASLAAALPWGGMKQLPRVTSVCVALALFGFALRSGAAHAQLRDREGGRPMYQTVARDGATLLFVDTDHGFNLAFDPDAPARVARRRGGDFDRLTWELRGKPAAFLYHYQWSDRLGVAWIEPANLEPIAAGPLALHAENFWPPASQRGAWAWPTHTTVSCVEGGRFLAVFPTSPDNEISLRIPPALAGRSLALTLVRDRLAFALPMNFKELESSGESPTVELRDSGQVLQRWRGGSGRVTGCETLQAAQLPSKVNSLVLTVVSSGPIGVDVLSFGEKR
jgi:hypothetical protein